jgi:hypothetical protein
MTKIFSVEILICATAYIRADSEDQAAEIAKSEMAYGTEASTSSRSSFGDIEVSESQFSDDGMPDVSLSPAMTFCGSATELSPGSAVFLPGQFECVYGDEDEDEEVAS